MAAKERQGAGMPLDGDDSDDGDDSFEALTPPAPQHHRIRDQAQVVGQSGTGGDFQWNHELGGDVKLLNGRTEDQEMLGAALALCGLGRDL